MASIDTSGESVGLPPGQMGNSEVGRLTSLKTGRENNLLDNANLVNASRIVELATSQVAANLRARLGAFSAHRITSTVNALQAALENISAARSIIVDTDFAAETATLVQQQILVQSNTTIQAIANARPLAIRSNRRSGAGGAGLIQPSRRDAATAARRFRTPPAARPQTRTGHCSDASELT